MDAEVWKDLQVGDRIEFWEDLTGWQTEPTEGARKAVVVVKQIYRAPTFLELFNEIEKDLSLLDNHNDLLNDLQN